MEFRKATLSHLAAVVNDADNPDRCIDVIKRVEAVLDSVGNDMSESETFAWMLVGAMADMTVEFLTDDANGENPNEREG